MSDQTSQTFAARPRPNFLAILAFALAIAAFFFPRPPRHETGPVLAHSTLERIRDTKVLRVGFEGYPPYAVRNPSDGTMSGYSVDLAEAIARDADWTVEWVETSPQTKISDLKDERFDVMVEPIFQTIERAKEVAFTHPYAYFGYAAGIVRKGETRFSQPSDLNHKGVVVVVRQGYTDEAYAKRHLPTATVRSMQVDDINLAFLEVIAGKADIALADASQVAAFYAAHSNEVDTRFLEPPPASVPAGFMVRQDDLELATFLNTALDYLEANGLFDELDARYHVVALREHRNLR